MADTMDRRSEGIQLKSMQAAKNRGQARARKAAGFCRYCGVVEVRNRAVCYTCVDRQRIYNAANNIRWLASKHPDRLQELLREPKVAHVLLDIGAFIFPMIGDSHAFDAGKNFFVVGDQMAQVVISGDQAAQVTKRKAKRP